MAINFHRLRLRISDPGSGEIDSRRKEVLRSLLPSSTAETNKGRGGTKLNSVCNLPVKCCYYGGSGISVHMALQP